MKSGHVFCNYPLYFPFVCYYLSCQVADPSDECSGIWANDKGWKEQKIRLFENTAPAPNVQLTYPHLFYCDSNYTDTLRRIFDDVTMFHTKLKCEGNERTVCYVMCCGCEGKHPRVSQEGQWLRERPMLEVTWLSLHFPKGGLEEGHML